MLQSCSNLSYKTYITYPLYSRRTLTQGFKKIFIRAFNNKETTGMQYEILETKIADTSPRKIDEFINITNLNNYIKYWLNIDFTRVLLFCSTMVLYTYTQY